MPRSRRFIPSPVDSARIDELYRTLGYKETAAVLGVPIERVRRWKSGKGTLSQSDKTALKNAWDYRDFYDEVVAEGRKRGNTHAAISDAIRRLVKLPGLGDNRFKRRQKRGKISYDYSGNMPKARRNLVRDIFGTLGIPPSGLAAIYKRKTRRR